MKDKEPRTSTPELTRKQKLLRRTLPLAMTGAVVVGAATPAGSEALSNARDTVAEAIFGDESLNFSSELSTYVTEPGDTLWEISHKVEGSDQVDPRLVVDYIESLPENADIKDENGNLATGVQVSYPTRIEAGN